MTESFIFSGVSDLAHHGLIRIHVGELEADRGGIDFADRDTEDMRDIILDVPKRMRPRLTRASRT